MEKNVNINGSGCKDLTAGTAINNVVKDEIANKVIKAIKMVAEIWGFEVTNRIHLTDKKTGKEYR